MRNTEEIQITTSRKVYKRLYKKVECLKEGRCSLCGWHQGENLKNYRRHGVHKSRKKDHR